MQLPGMSFGSGADLGSPIAAISSAYNWLTGSSPAPSGYSTPRNYPTASNYPTAAQPHPFAPSAPQSYVPMAQIQYPGLPADPSENDPEGTPWYEDKRILIGVGVALVGMTAAFAFATRK